MEEKGNRKSKWNICLKFIAFYGHLLNEFVLSVYFKVETWLQIKRFRNEILKFKVRTLKLEEISILFTINIHANLQKKIIATEAMDKRDGIF